MHYTTLKYTTLHCDALHCDKLHFTDALHNKKERHSLINIVIYVHCDDNAHMFLFPCWFPFLGLVGHSSNISSLGFRCTNSGFKARQFLQAIHYGKSEPWLLRLFLGRVWSLPQNFPRANPWPHIRLVQVFQSLTKHGKALGLPGKLNGVGPVDNRPSTD